MPRYAVTQDATWKSATGSRAQLNMLMDDKIKEVKNYTYTPMSEIDLSGKKQKEEAQARLMQDSAAKEARANAPKTMRFVPQYMEEGQFIESREISYKVNNCRTPSGNFFQTSNPAIYQDIKEKKFEGEETVSVDALIATGKISSYNRGGTVGAETAKAAIPDEVMAGDVGAVETAQQAAASSWLLPHQTGTRNLDLAKKVGAKRTPNGAFALHGLPVYGRS